MLTVVASLVVGFVLLIWRSHKSGARRYEALLEQQEKDRNPIDVT